MWIALVPMLAWGSIGLVSGKLGGDAHQLRVLYPSAGRGAESPAGLGLEVVLGSLPLLPAGFAAHPAFEQRDPEPDAGAADFQPDVPPPLAGG